LLEKEFRRNEMDAFSVYVLLGWSALHLAALTLAWGTRLANGSRLESAIQLVFFVVMAAVGCAAAVCRQLEISAWTVSAVVLVAMVLTAVVDFRRYGDPVHATTQSAGC
jgi:hypothetical protein